MKNWLKWGAIGVGGLLVVLFIIGTAGGDEGGDNGILHLTGRDISESDHQLIVRRAIQDQPAGFNLICQSIRGASPAEAAVLLRPSNPTVEVDADRGDIAKPGQVADQKSLERASQIVQEVCEQVR